MPVSVRTATDCICTAYTVYTACIQSSCTVRLSAGVSLQGKVVVWESSKKAHLMIGRRSDCVKKEVPWNPSVTISHNQIIISGPRKNCSAPTSLCAECILGKCICESDETASPRWTHQSSGATAFLGFLSKL